jgi:hypothetical protein
MPIVAIVVFGAGAFAVLNLFVHFLDYRAFVYGVGQIVVGAAVLWLIGLLWGAADFAAILSKAQRTVVGDRAVAGAQPDQAPRHSTAKLYDHVREIIHDAIDMRQRFGNRWRHTWRDREPETLLSFLEVEAEQLRRWVSHRDLFLTDEEIVRLTIAEVQRLSRIFHRVLGYSEETPFDQDRRRAIVAVIAVCLDLPAPCRIYLLHVLLMMPHHAHGFQVLTATP